MATDSSGAEDSASMVMKIASAAEDSRSIRSR